MLEIKTQLKETSIEALTKDSGIERESWSIDSWKQYKISQQPKYEDASLVQEIIDKINIDESKITTINNINTLKEELSTNIENRFLIIAGDCAETFNDKETDIVYKKCAFYNYLGYLLSLKYKKRAVLLGRIAGQYAKPRSSDYETINGGKII